MNPIADHLWQSTIFACVVWLLILALRNNHARVRHGLWLAASGKFLIPFSVLIALGGQFQWRTAPAIAPSSVTVVIEQVSQPFTASVEAATVPPAPNPFSGILLAVWACGFIGITGAWWIRWRRIRSVVRTGSPLHLELPIKAMSSPTLLEPGVFGILRPVLLLPEGIFDRLTPAQLQAVIAHELCHVRHRDNLIAAIHMFVETVFWFHPLVWWIGKRMVEERERACDEEVLREIGEPKAYAEGILNVCKFYVESPLRCVSGVTGSNLKKRIEVIMSNRIALKLNFGKKFALVVTGMAVLAMPFVMGITHAQSPAAATPKFEVVSIRPNHSGSTSSDLGPPNGNRFAATNVYIQRLIRVAYNVQDFQISGVPGWLESDRFDIAANADRTGITFDQYRLMLQSLLADRFRLEVHRETREQPVLALVVTGGGAKIKETNCIKEQPSAVCETAVRTDRAGGSLSGHSVPMTELASIFTSITSRIVLDQTRLSGKYDINLKWSPDSGDVVAGPSLFTALQEQLGLKLESTKGPVETLVIDHVEKPSEN